MNVATAGTQPVISACGQDLGVGLAPFGGETQSACSVCVTNRNPELVPLTQPSEHQPSQILRRAEVMDKLETAGHGGLLAATKWNDRERRRRRVREACPKGSSAPSVTAHHIVLVKRQKLVCMEPTAVELDGREKTLF